MATTTSSSKRSTRKTRQPVRSDKGRPNRQKASTAKVTNSSTRPTNSGAKITNSAQRTSTGTAKVTSAPKALPPGNKGGALTATSKPNLLPAGNKGGALTRTLGKLTASTPKALSGLKGGIVGAGIYAVGERVTNAVGQRAGEQLGKALKPLGRAIDERRAANKDTKGGRRQNLRGGRSTGGQPSRPIANLPPSANQPSQYPAGVGTRQASSPGAPARSTNDGQARRQSAQRASSGSVTPSSGSSRPSPARPSQAAPRTTTGGSEKGSGSAPGTRRWEDFNKGRGTSETNNPLIKNNAWLMSKIKEREERESKKMDDDDKKKKSAAVKAGWDGNKNY